MKTITTLLKALSDETRLRILHLLIQSGELCVCDIEDVIGGPQTKISRHLAYLRRSGLVSTRKKGLWMLYSIPKTLSTEQRSVLSCVAGLLDANSIARKDRGRFLRNMQEGCCATFTDVIPGQVPVVVRINQMKGSNNGG
ncbi:MAG: metalloregulator ArsR/SmtB family transcription factor [Ignavibacteria bacterium]|nr:metalloregulator ArsR/SmtB family transcription factor [Ignavibacteria bacterium]